LCFVYEEEQCPLSDDEGKAPIKEVLTLKVEVIKKGKEKTELLEEI
jgi:hypothetical protein